MGTPIEGTYNATPPTLLTGTDSSLQVDVRGNLKITPETKVSTPSDAPVEAFIKPSDSRVAITASAQILSGPGKLKGFWVISCTSTATVRFSDALTATTPYVGTALVLTSTIHTPGTYVKIAEDGMDMATGCYCTIAVAAAEILVDADLNY